MAQGLIRTDRLDSILRTTKNPNEKVDLILKFLNKPENQYLENSIDFANRAFTIAQQNNYALGKVQAMIKLGYYYFRSSNYKKAMEFAQKSKEMSEDLNFDKELANSLSLIGTIYTELGDYDKSSQYYFKSLKLYEKVDDKEGISRLFGFIGMDFYNQQDYKKALEYYNKSLSIAKQINIPSIIKSQYNNIANVYGVFMKYDTAIVLFRKALTINTKLGDRLGEGTNIMNIGYVQMNKGYFDDARLSFQESLGIFIELNNRLHMAECYINFGYCYYSINGIEESIDYFKKALQEGQKNGYYRIISHAAKMLNQIYTLKQDTIKAYKYVTLEKIAGDSLYASQEQKHILKLELQYLYEKKEIEKQKVQHAKNIIILIVIFSLISGLVILGLILSRHRLKSKLVVAEKEKIEFELKSKDRELTVNLISLIKKNEMITDISNKLGQLEQNTKSSETKDKIIRISKELRNSTEDKMFNEFTTRFQEVHAGFYEKLLKSYPDLTKNELNLCAFLRLNMSSKDISELTNQQVSAIEQARYRLRKKLGIVNLETNLVTFLSQI
ncbi:MAG: tetratricopeptide repeat protein [Bacteroidales bacterium]|nr:tetratricopeptide repeat protein [Bacteroidales bacterium]